MRVDVDVELGRVDWPLERVLCLPALGGRLRERSGYTDLNEIRINGGKLWGGQLTQEDRKHGAEYLVQVRQGDD